MRSGTGIECGLASLDSRRINGNRNGWWRRFAGQGSQQMSHGAHLLWEGRVLELLLGNRNMGRAKGDLSTWMVCGAAGTSGEKGW